MSLPSLERTIGLSSSLKAMSEIRANIQNQHRVIIEEKKLVTGEIYFTCRNTTGDTLASGYGKGSHSVIGAFGECIEHYHLRRLRENQSRHEIPVSVGDLCREDIFVRAGNKLNKECRDVHSLPFYDFEKTSPVYLPSLLIGYCSFNSRRDQYDHERFFSRYSSSNGSAFGLTFDDAFLHSLLEIVERHEISLLFLRICGLERSDTSYMTLSDYEFCEEVYKEAASISRHHNVGPITTLLKKSTLGCFFSLTFTSKHMSDGSKRIVWGAGCSLFRDLAIYRSITECRQLLSNDMTRVDDRIDIVTERYRSFAAIQDFDLFRLNLEPARLEPCITRRISTKAQVQNLQSAIASTGRRILFFKHEPACASYCVVTSYITSTEKFYGIIFAVPVLPISHLERFLEAN